MAKQTANLSIHLLKLCLGVAVVCLLGWLSGHWLLVTWIGLAAYLGWQLLNLFRLALWLHRSNTPLPKGYGLWAQLFERLEQLQRDNRRQRRQMHAVIGEFQSATDAFPDPTIVIDSSDNILWFNQSAEEMLGLQRPADQGQSITNLIRDPEFADWLAIREDIESNQDLTSPVNDQLRLNVRAVRYRQDQSLLLFRDVTEIQRLEKIRRDFVANVSHELRTPLTVLMGYLDTLQYDCPENMEPAIQRMLSQGRNMQQLIEDLLELSRLQNDQITHGEQIIDMPAMLIQLREQAEELSQGRHTIKVDFDETLHLYGMERDIESAFRNLIANAVNYTPEGGTITLDWQATGESLVFAVSDTGVGIPTKEIPRITERFYRVGSDRARSSGGTGLGLAIVKHVLNSHQAKLDIVSELGEGSSFSCIFPHSRKAEVKISQAL